MRRGVTGALIGALAVLGATGAIGPQAVVGASTERGEGARIALIGQFEYAQEAAAWRLVDGGIYDIDVGTQGVGSSTDLVLVTVSALDGPMPSMRAALDSLDGLAIPRVAIVLTATDHQPDTELQQLVTVETRELLAGYGIADPEVPVVQSDDPGFVPAVAAILDGDPAGYTVAAPPPPVEGAAQIVPQNMLGVPYPDAVRILTDDGFQPTVVVDPTAGIVSECFPGVVGQYPDIGTAVDPGATIVLAVWKPDPFLNDATCSLTEFPDEAAFDEFIAQTLAASP
jgi:hypothetical protein